MFNDYSIIDIAVSIVLFLIMFGIGLSQTTSNYKRLFIAPKALLLGLFAQMILLPVIAFLIVAFVNIPPEFKIGFIILSACPGGTTSGLINYIFKGDVALSISLTSINGLLTLLTIPFIVNLGLLFFLKETAKIYLPYTDTIIQIFVVTIIPAMLGLALRMKNERLALKLQRPAKIILTVLLAAVFAVILFAKEDQGGTGITWQQVQAILPYAILLNIIAFFAPYWLVLSAKLKEKTSFTIGIEVTLQNTSLAFLIAGALLDNQDMMKPALVYSLFSFWTTIIFAFIIKRKSGLRLFSDFR